MKKTFYFFAVIAVFAFISCKKDNPTANSNTATIQYNFTTDRAGNFNVEFSTDSSQAGEAVNSLTWSKTVTINKQSTARAINFIVHPPFEWTTTADQANVTIKILVDGVEKSSNSAVMGGIDHPAGLTATTNL